MSTFDVKTPFVSNKGWLVRRVQASSKEEARARVSNGEGAIIKAIVDIEENYWGESVARQADPTRLPGVKVEIR